MFAVLLAFINPLLQNEFWVFFTTPVQAAIAIYLLYQLLGNSVFAALGIMLVTAPVSFGIAYFQRRHRVAAMKIKDERIKMINETLSSIKVSSTFTVL
ncbi:hypothetical protein EB796_017310 [Bugula neritina]|uniref:ABC transmembrane type-1 domain-containing protein n=1 Tax=Bugula neritina TaxID=10212 RepID=A0A7J7JG99_BUGNE|nr:hypothetical protein EB796_017310 [Bugula neritina]